MPKQKKSAKTQENQEQQDTQIKYIKSSKIEEIEKKCSEYKKIQEQIQELGFPVNPASDQVIKELIQKQDQLQLGKYLASHYWGKQSDLLTKINEKLVEYGFQVTDDLQCEQIITININNKNIGNKYDYKKLFELKDTACPSQLLNVDHYSSEIITKFVESTDNSELQQLLTIRKNIQDILNKLDKIRLFSNKLQNIKSQSAEDKLLKQFDNLEKDYYLVKNTQYNFDKLSQQKKTKKSKKIESQTENDNKQNNEQNQEDQMQNDNQKQQNINQEQKQDDEIKQQKKSKANQPKNKTKVNENEDEDGEQNQQQIQNKKEKKTKKSQLKQKRMTQNQNQQGDTKKESTENINENILLQQSQNKKESNKKKNKTKNSQETDDDPKQKKLDQFFKKREK